MSKDDIKSRKNNDRETYSFMVNNKTVEGKSMINFLNDIKTSGDKIGNYIKKLILKDMNNTANEHSDVNLSNSLLLEKLDKQEIMLKNLTNIIENQNREMSLLYKLLDNGCSMNNFIVSETSVKVIDKDKEKNEDAEHEAFLEKAKNAVVAPDLASIMMVENDTLRDTVNEDEDEDDFDFDFGDEDDE